MYYVWAVLLVLWCLLSWGSTLFGLPGNWALLLGAVIFAWRFPQVEDQGLSWYGVGVAAGLVVLGEIVEFATAAAGAAKQGASRRAMALSLIGTMVGSVLGAVIGVPIPVVGPIVAAVGGGAAGAFGGAWLGETWKGRTPEERLEVSKAAMIGRLMGTAGKLALGAIAAVVVAVDVFL
jgi:uncharacterized protein YqgC (DUF456 family)